MPAAQKKCPHCGAKVGPAWSTCWLCGLQLGDGLPPDDRADAGRPVEAEEAVIVPPSDSASVVATIGKVAGFFLAGIIALIMLGMIANGEYGGAIFFLVLLVPAGVVTMTKTVRSHSRGVELSGLEKLGTFMMSLAVTIGAVVLLGVAAFAALCVVCIVALSTNGGGNLFR